MKAINAIIIEDMEIAEKHLKKMLEDHCPQVNVIASFRSGREALPFLQKLNFDLLFLDIEYNDDYNAFALLSDLDFNDIHIIFTTAYDTYRRQASEAQTIKYLLKPICKEELIKAVERSMLIKIGKEHLKDIQKTHDALSSGKIIINSGGTSYFIHPSDIICCEAEGAYSRIFYITGQELVQILCSQNLGRYENILNSNRFLRVHKKYLVNTDYVKSCKRNKLKLVANKEEIQVLIARDRRKEILEQIAINREDMGL